MNITTEECSNLGVDQLTEGQFRVRARDGSVPETI